MMLKTLKKQREPTPPLEELFIRRTGGEMCAAIICSSCNEIAGTVPLSSIMGRSWWTDKERESRLWRDGMATKGHAIAGCWLASEEGLCLIVKHKAEEGRVYGLVEEDLNTHIHRVSDVARLAQELMDDLMDGAEKA